MANRKFLVAALFTVLSVASMATKAADYFVSQGGSDASPGLSIAAPKRDLQQAIDMLKPGDSLTIVGDYHMAKPIAVRLRGTDTAPITISGTSSSGAKTGGLTCDCGSANACISIADTSNVRWTNDTFNGQGMTCQSYVKIERSQSVTLDHNTFVSVGGYGVYLAGDRTKDKNHVFDANTMESGRETGFFLNKTIGLTVTNNTVLNFTNGDGIVASDSDYVTISGNRVENLTGFNRDGIKVRPSANVSIKGNTVQYVTGVGIYMRAADATGFERYRSTKVTISGNTVTEAARKNLHNPDPTCAGGTWPSALNVTLTDDVQVDRNLVYRNHGEGITISDTTQARVVQNNAHTNYAVNYYLNNASDVLLDRNLGINDPSAEEFFRCLAPAGGISMANETSNYNNFKPLKNITITNNILAKGRFGINFFYKVDGPYWSQSNLTDVAIVNNTVHDSKSYSMQIEPAGTLPHSRVRIESNIFSHPQAGAPVTIGSQPTEVTCRANLWWSAMDPTVCTSPDTDVRADPLFVGNDGEAAADYRITSESPATDSARYSTIMPYVWVDYFGTKRALSPWDIGAHEFRKTNQR